jgi:hypothetical protein
MASFDNIVNVADYDSTTGEDRTNYPFKIVSAAEWSDGGKDSNWLKTDWINAQGTWDQGRTLTMGKPIPPDKYANVSDAINNCNWRGADKCPKLDRKLIFVRDDPRYAVDSVDYKRANVSNKNNVNLDTYEARCPDGYWNLGFTYARNNLWGPKNSGFDSKIKCIDPKFINLTYGNHAWFWNNAGHDDDDYNDWSMYYRSPYHAFFSRDSYTDDSNNWPNWDIIPYERMLKCCTGDITSGCGMFRTPDGKNIDQGNCDKLMNEYCTYMGQKYKQTTQCPVNDNECVKIKNICSCYNSQVPVPICLDSTCRKSGYQSKTDKDTLNGGCKICGQFNLQSLGDKATADVVSNFNQVCGSDAGANNNLNTGSNNKLNTGNTQQNQLEINKNQYVMYGSIAGIVAIIFCIACVIVIIIMIK